MEKNGFNRMWLLNLIIFALLSVALSAQDKVEFSSSRWLKEGRTKQIDGREAFAGHGELPDVDFEDGTIEVDLWVTGQRSYPGIVFRIVDGRNNEKVYLRPHRAGLYPDAIQYTPTFNEVAGWQLYHGVGCTEHLEIAEKQWVTIKLEIKGKEGKLYYGDNPLPALEIKDLKHGYSRGSIGVDGPSNGTAWFSNFRFQKEEVSERKSSGAGKRGETWSVSRIIPAKDLDLEKQNYPRFFTIKMGQWQQAFADEKGMLDIARYVQRDASQPELVLVRKIFYSDSKKTLELPFGYSDEVAVFMNKKKVFYGNSSYRSRDQSFTGVIGLNDTLFLDVEEGLNEIFFVVKESFGGWGLMVKPGIVFPEPEVDLGAAELAWETPATMKTPESACFDAKRKVFYISNFDVNYKPDAAEAEYTGFISKVGLDGKIEKLRWIDKLHAPCGMDIFQDRLYVAERGMLAVIDIEKEQVVNRYQIEGTEFLNDLIIDGEGAVYISDTASSSPTGSRIYRFKDGKSDLWLNDHRIRQANGIFIIDNKLIVGSSGDGILKSVDLKTKQIEEIVSLGAGVQDGIRIDEKGNLLLSHWEGMVYRVSPEGEIIRIVDTQVSPVGMADFEYLKEEKLLVVPTFLGNKVVAYRLK